MLGSPQGSPGQSRWWRTIRLTVWFERPLVLRESSPLRCPLAACSATAESGMRPKTIRTARRLPARLISQVAPLGGRAKESILALHETFVPGAGHGPWAAQEPQECRPVAHANTRFPGKSPV